MSFGLLQMIPESSSAMLTSGRPTDTWKAVWIGVPAAMQELVPEGIVALGSVMLIPMTPHSSSICEFTFSISAASTGSLAGGIAGVAPKCCVSSVPRFVTVSPGASFHVDGSPALPLP